MQDRISTLASYETYPYKNKSSKYYLTKLEYNKIIRAINYKAFELMLTTGEKFKEPSNIGYKQILKSKGNPINKHQTAINKEGLKIKHLNFHTDGYTARLKWFKKGVKFNSNWIWQFDLNRMAKRPNHSKKRELNMKDFIVNNGLDHLHED